MLYFEWDIINYGKTPAFVYETATHFLRFDTIAGIPEQPKYKPFVLATQKTVLPTKEHSGDGVAIVGDYEEIKAKHAAWECVLYAYGYVKYRDIFRRTHETRYGFIFESTSTLGVGGENSFYAGGPERYNQYT
jgi:hypothetical protein